MPNSAGTSTSDSETTQNIKDRPNVVLLLQLGMVTTHLHGEPMKVCTMLLYVKGEYELMLTLTLHAIDDRHFVITRRTSLKEQFAMIYTNVQMRLCILA